MWWYYTREREQADVDKFRARIWRPPPRTTVIDARSPWSVENETKAFAAFKAQATG